MDDNEFWVICWSLIAGVLVVITLSITVYAVYETKRVLNAADPVAAACAVSNRQNPAPCMVVLGRGK